jgi:hypothetical protein
MKFPIFTHLCSSDRANAGHKWRAGEPPENAETTPAETNQNSPKPHDTARPSSCPCYK